MSGLRGKSPLDLSAVQFWSATRMMLSSSSRNEQDARRVFDVLPKRFAKYGLTVHPEKTRLVDFRRPDRRALPSPYNGDARSRPGTFDLLGFTHYWAKSRKGYWVVKQKTAADRLRRALKRITDWCRRNRHEPVREQWTALKTEIAGALWVFRYHWKLPSASQLLGSVSCGAWRKWLSRRSQRAWISVGKDDSGCWSGIRCRGRVIRTSPVT